MDMHPLKKVVLVSVIVVALGLALVEVLTPVVRLAFYLGLTR